MRTTESDEDRDVVTGVPSAQDYVSPGDRPAIETALDEIADDLWCQLDLSSEGGIDDASVRASDTADAALFFAYLNRVHPDRDHLSKSRRCLDVATDIVAGSRTAAQLYGGFIEVAWVVEHLGDMASEDCEEDPTGDIEAALRDVMSSRPWRFDLVTGLAGVGVYALERRLRGDECLGEVVEALAKIAVSDGDGVWWRTRPEWMVPSMAAHYPDGWYDLGVAHGLAGVIHVLSGAVARDVRRETALPLLQGAVRRLLRHRSSGDLPSSFPGQVDARGGRKESRVAWCYGDAGIAAVLMTAASVLKDDELRAGALEVGRRLRTVDAGSFGVRDASVCHGTAGLALTFMRMHSATQDQTLRDGASFWLKRTTDLHRPGRAGGFLYQTDPGGAAAGLKPNRSLIEGTAGVGLVLVAALQPGLMAWDALLALSLPARH